MWTERRHLWVLIGIVLLALAARVGCVLVLGEMTLTRDDIQYEQIAWNLVSRRGYSLEADPPFEPTARRAPVYPLFVAGIYALLGRSLISVYLSQSLVGALTVVGIHVLTRQVTRRPWALWSATLMAAFWPALAIYCSRLLVEVVLVALMVAFLWSWGEALRRKQWLWYAISGVLLGLVTLCRPTTLPFPLVIALVVWLKDRLGPAIRLSVVAALVFLLTLVPWTVRNYLVFGEVYPITSRGLTDQLWFGNLTATDDPADPNAGSDRQVAKTFTEVWTTHTPGEAARIYLQMALEDISSNPGKYVGGIFAKMYKLWRYPIGGPTISRLNRWAGLAFQVVYVAMLVFCVWGSVTFRREWIVLLPHWSLIGFTTMVHGLMHAIPRYHFPLLPSLCVLFGLGVASVSEQVLRWWKGKQ